MLKTAELLFKAPESDKSTILLLIDRNELEDQLMKNLAALGMENVEHAHSIARLNQLLGQDHRGIIVSTIHKFRDMPANLNTRRNIFVLVDEDPSHDRRRSGQLSDGGAAQRNVFGLYRHAD